MKKNIHDTDTWIIAGSPPMIPLLVGGEPGKKMKNKTLVILFMRNLCIFASILRKKKNKLSHVPIEHATLYFYELSRISTVFLI
jgi:hypothetical protein